MASPSPEQLAALKVYCNCLQSTKQRLVLIERITSGALRIDTEAIDAEFAFLQLRKVLELLAFASVSAHKDLYAEAYADFATHWNPKKLFQKLAKLHPDFYPRPVSVAGPDARGVKKLVPIDKPHLGKDDFVFLYDTCSQVIHEWNPYREDPRIIDSRISVAEWIARIRALLEVHWIRLAGTPDVWVVQYNGPNGNVHAVYAADVPETSLPEPPLAQGVT